MSTTTTLATSEGWNWKPPMLIQRVAPPDVVPTRRTSTSSTTVPTHRMGSARRQSVR